MKSILLLLCLGLVLNLPAQEFKLSYSAPGAVKNDITQFHKYGNSLFSYETVWGKAQFAYSATLKKVKYGVNITKYDENLKVIKQLSLDNGENNLGPFSPIVHWGQEAVYVLYFRFEGAADLKMYMSKVNPADLSLVATKEIMNYDQKNKAFWGSFEILSDAKTFFTVSQDGKSSWIVHASSALMLTCVVDADLNIIQKVESIPVTQKKMIITSACISNDGNKALTYSYDDPELRRFFGRGLFFQPANAKGIFKPIKLTENYCPRHMELAQSKDGKKIYIAGGYFREDFDIGEEGVLVGEIDVAGQMMPVPKFYPYTDQIKQRILDLAFASKVRGKVVFNSHPYYRITELEDGTVVLSTDVRTEEVYTGPIIHVFVAVDGNANMTLIPKRQAVGSSTKFFNYVYKDRLVCIYGDLPRNLEQEIRDSKLGLTRTLGDIVPIANVYDATGKLLSRRMLINDTKNLKGNISLEDRSLIDKNKFLFPVGETKVNMVKYYTSIDQMCYLEIL